MARTITFDLEEIDLLMTPEQLTWNIYITVKSTVLGKLWLFKLLIHMIKLSFWCILCHSFVLV